MKNFIVSKKIFLKLSPCWSMIILISILMGMGSVALAQTHAVEKNKIHIQKKGNPNKAKKIRKVIKKSHKATVSPDVNSIKTEGMKGTKGTETIQVDNTSTKTDPKAVQKTDRKINPKTTLKTEPLTPGITNKPALTNTEANTVTQGPNATLETNNNSKDIRDPKDPKHLNDINDPRDPKDLTDLKDLKDSNILKDPNKHEVVHFKTQRARFLQAESAFARGQVEQYKKLKSQLHHYPLYPYLLYAEYDKNIQTLSLENFQSFVEKYVDTPLAEQLRSHWLQVKAKQEDWQSFLKAYIPSDDVSLQCQFLWAELNTRQDKNPIFEQILPIWLSGKERPKACECVFKEFEKSALLTSPLIWQRIKLAIHAGNVKLARYMTQFIKKSEVAFVELWIMVHNNPQLVLQRKYFAHNHPSILEILVYGVTQIAKSKPEIAIQVWQQIGHKYPFSQRHWGGVVREIGLAFAVQKKPEAEKWLSEVPDVYANQSVHEWRMRISLGKEDWRNLMHWSSRLPEALSSNETWLYWQGRALEKLNRNHESEALLSKLAQTRSYYGFLASQHLGKPYFIAHQKFALDAESLLSIAQKKSVQRARELYALNREPKARMEWVYSTQRMTDAERHAAAALAIRWGLPNWSILALSKANNKNDLELRFPVVYSEPIIQEAKRHQIDPAMIFAVTRQESAFVTNAKSSSGALGLMQLMPTTAQSVAKKSNMKFRGLSSLFEPHTNIRLGAHYLRMMLDNYENNAILATAAYNAGPGRIRKWLPPKDTPADAWIETIPFKETREYVKNVMTYTIIYQQLLGQKTKLPKRLPAIPASTQ